MGILCLPMTAQGEEQEQGIRFLAEVIEAPVPADPANSPYPNVISEVRIRTDLGEEWILLSWVMRDRKKELFANLQVGCLIGVHVVAWDEQSEEIRSQNCNNPSGDFETQRVWALSWIPHPSSPVPLKDDVAATMSEAPNLAMMRSILSRRGGPAIQGTDDPHSFFLSSGRIYEDQFWVTKFYQGRAISPMEAIVSFRDRLVAQGTELLVVIVPRKETLIPGYVTRIPYDPSDGRVNSSVEALGTALSNEGVEVLDLTNRFIAERYYQTEGQRFFLYETKGTHWSSYGASLAADSIRSRLEKMGYQDYLVERAEHLARLQSPTVGEEAPLDQLVKGTFSDPSNSSVQTSFHAVKDGFPRPNENSSPPIYLLGDSFSTYATKPRTGFNTHLDSHLKHPLRVISSPGQAATTVRSLWLSDEKSSGAKLVIWEIAECFLGVPHAWLPLGGVYGAASTDLVSDLPPTEIEMGERRSVVMNDVASEGFLFGSNINDQRTLLGNLHWKGIQVTPERRRLTFLCGGVTKMENNESLWATTAPIVEIFINGELVDAHRCPCFFTTFVNVDLPDSLSEEMDLQIRVNSQTPELIIDQVSISAVSLSP